MREAITMAGRAWALPERDLISALEHVHRLEQQLAAARLKLVRELDARGTAVRAGATSTTVWLRDRLRVSASTARKQVSLARDLDAGLPVTAAALTVGDINTEQAAVIADAVRDLSTEVDAETRGKAEQALVEQAARFEPVSLRTIGARILEHVAPHLADEVQAKKMADAEQRIRRERGFTLTPDGAGRVKLSGLLDSESAAVVNAALDPLCAPDAGDAAGQRSPAQRRADALTEICRRALISDTLPDNGGQRPQVTITIEFDVLRGLRAGIGHTDDGNWLSSAAVRRIACDAQLIPAVLGGDGQVLDLGRSRRLFSGPIRRAIAIRDRGCAWPGCDRPPTWADVHHIVPWIDGGRTDMNNAVMVCGTHHRLLHDGDWQVRMGADHRPEFLPPPWIDPERRPVRNHHRQPE